jgi:nucleoid DNA-binding protein
VTKKEIVRTISQELGLTQLQTKVIVQKTFNAIIDTLLTDERIELRNFGVFEVKKRKARKARNPRTGDKVSVPEKWVVTFKPGKEMEEKVDVLDLALTSLNGDDRQLILWRHEGLSDAKIAERLGVMEEKAREMINVANRRLLDLVDKLCAPDGVRSRRMDLSDGSDLEDAGDSMPALARMTTPDAEKAAAGSVPSSPVLGRDENRSS